jgi:hypothetical protein
VERLARHSGIGDVINIIIIARIMRLVAFEGLIGVGGKFVARVGMIGFIYGLVEG